MDRVHCKNCVCLGKLRSCPLQTCVSIQVNTEIVSIQKVITPAGAAHLKELIQVRVCVWCVSVCLRVPVCLLCVVFADLHSCGVYVSAFALLAELRINPVKQRQGLGWQAGVCKCHSHILREGPSPSCQRGTGDGLFAGCSSLHCNAILLCHATSSLHIHRKQCHCAGRSFTPNMSLCAPALLPKSLSTQKAVIVCVNHVMFTHTLSLLLARVKITIVGRCTRYEKEYHT